MQVDRLGTRDVFMLAALWMETFPLKTPGTRTGALLVDSRDRIVALSCTQNAHAVVRAILSASDPAGCDVYVSRFPCALCTKMCVQAQIRRIYYFPAQLSEVSSEKLDLTAKAVSRLITNNPIALTLYVPRWTKETTIVPDFASSITPIFPEHPLNQLDISSIGTKLAGTTISETDSIPKENDTLSVRNSDLPKIGGLTINTASRLTVNTNGTPSKRESFDQNQQQFWQIDESLLSKLPSLVHRWEMVVASFRNTNNAILAINAKYSSSLPAPMIVSPALSTEARNQSSEGNNEVCDNRIEESHDERKQMKINVDIARHAIVLAHIVSKRTDDPKIGVGAVIVNPQTQTYVSAGWNGFPKRATSTDYPIQGADDFPSSDDSLKYDYILHAEQNALLWRSPPALPVAGMVLVSTKMPCDECSPVMADFGITSVITNPQLPKRPDDPARLRGLTYEKLERLIPDIWIFPHAASSICGPSSPLK